MADRALVLGGGGVVGIAWETGVLKGLADAGADPAAADLVVGTSAGSVVGAQVRAGRSLNDLYAAQLAPNDGAVERNMGDIDTQSLMAVFGTWAATQEMTPQIGAEIGRMAQAARTVSEDAWISTFDTLVGLGAWPERPYVATAVDTETGALATWDRVSGAPVTRAIASSCAVPGMFPPVTIAGRRYMDGGVRSGTNADLARDHDLVVVLAPIGARPEGIGGIARRQLDAEVATLRAAGSTVEVILPDDAAIEAFGPNLMDPSRRVPAAEAGLRQGLAIGAALRAAWAGATV
ncbi:MAG: patatin-like phospholipase family protein [Chloroflexi bacterium]|nr:patatin-like phospholipase family protein [Chloroflexota bacterium]